MQKDIHTAYHPDAKIRCACGASYDVGSTIKEIKVEICSNCHPFYTGKQKLVDTARRVEKFEAKSAKRAEKAKTRKGQTAKKAALKAKRLTKIAVRKTVTKIGSGRRKTSDANTKPAAKNTSQPKAAVKDGNKADSK